MPYDRSRPRIARYGLALSAVGLAVALRVSLAPGLGLPGILLILLSAVALSATAGGTGPGLVALGASTAAAGYWLLEPLMTGRGAPVTPIVTLGIFFVTGATVVLLNRERRQAQAGQRSAQEAARAVRAQARTEAMFSAVLESAPYAVLTLNEEGVVVVANSQAEALFGYRRDELVGTSVERLLPEQLRQLHAAHRRDYHRSPRVRPMGPGLDLSARRKDGSVFPAQISLSPLHTDEGMLVTAIVRDITDERQAQEERLRLAREQAARREAEATERRSAFLADISAIVSSSLDYQTTLSNVARLIVPDLADWCSVDMLASDGRIEQLAVAHVDPDRARWARELRERFPLQASDEEGIARVIRTGQPQLYPLIPDRLIEERVKPPELRETLRQARLLSAMIVPLVGRDRILGAITFASTRESGRRFDRGDLAFAEEVARRAAIGVENAQLYGQAQEANRLKDDFLATLSHELRTPLNAVLGWTRLLQDSAMDDKSARHALDAILRNAKAQEQLISDLLDVSRIASGKVLLDCAEIDVAEVLAEGLDAIHVAAEGRHVQIDVASEPVRHVVWADRDRLRQVIWNLLSNAVKFTPPGGHVSVRIERRESDVQLSVRDTGVGIDPDFLPYIFDRFTQGDTSITRRYGGLGLGLAIVRSLVEMHGGSIHAESDGENRGSAFIVRLPGRAAPGRTSEPGDAGNKRLAISN